MRTNQIHRCACGRRTTKYASECRACSKAGIERAHEEARKVVATGRCPCCGAGLRRNSSLAGWWQCEQLGAEGFRKDPTKPSCRWQAFTE